MTKSTKHTAQSCISGLEPTLEPEPRVTLFNGDDPKLALLVRSLQERMQGDPTPPSLTLSYDTQGAMYRAQIIRYRGVHHQYAVVLTTATATDIRKAIGGALQQWIERITPKQSATELLIS
jgi:hypothetical protein